MNPSEFWVQLVNSTMAQSPTRLYDEAWRLTQLAHPDVYLAMRACGKTRAAVAFFNEKRAAKDAAPRTGAAREEFHNKVRERMDLARCDYDSAFAYVSRRHAELFNEANGGHRPTEFVNAGAGMPAFTPGMKKLFYLPMDATPAECEAAWNGNRQALSPVNPGKILSALTELTQRQKGQEYEVALKTVKMRCPELWAACEAISQLQF